MKRNASWQALSLQATSNNLINQFHWSKPNLRVHTVSLTSSSADVNRHITGTASSCRTFTLFVFFKPPSSCSLVRLGSDITPWLAFAFIHAAGRKLLRCGVCSSCVAQWEVRPEAGCRWGACSHTQLPPLGCLSAFQPFSFLMLKMHLSCCGMGEGKIWMTAYSKQPSCRDKPGRRALAGAASDTKISD